MRRITLFVLACLLFVNCAAVVISAPRGTNVNLLANEPTTVRITMRNWYLLWGLVPLTDNNTAAMVGRCNLNNVRVRVCYTPLQRLANIVMGLGLVETNTVIIDGVPGEMPGR